MNTTQSSGACVLEIPLIEIGQSYGRLRLVTPRADAAMLASVRRYGQMTPAVVGRPDGKQYELVDGFKRLRALAQLGQANLKAQVLDAGVRALKVSILHLNRCAGPLRDLEEALVVHSLNREDGLSQVEIGVLLGRHKSWVCRRIGLIEHLSPEALSHLELGLIGAGIGQQLSRLPGGNQGAALQSILTHRLTCRETETLIAELLVRPRWEHEGILRAPYELLPEPSPPTAVARQSLSHLALKATDRLRSLEPLSVTLIQRLNPDSLAALATDEREGLCEAAVRMQDRLHALCGLLKGVPHDSPDLP